MTKVPYLKRQLAYELSNQGYLRNQISDILCVSTTLVKYHSKKGFDTFEEFNSNLEKKITKSKPVSKNKINPLKRQIIYELTKLNYKRKIISLITDMKSPTYYMKTGFDSYDEFYEFANRKKTKDMSSKEHNDFIAKKKGYESHKHFRNEQNKDKKIDENIKKIKKVQDFKMMITYNLEKRNQTQTWLAKKTGIKRQSISNYCLAKNTPTEDNLKKIISAFEIEDSTLEYFLKYY